MLEIQRLIVKNPETFRDIFTDLKIKIIEDEHFMLLKYNQIESDFNNEIVQECRGIILNKDTWSVACHPFHKFGNYGESYAAIIDWSTAEVQEKLDGSLVKLWWNMHEFKWQWSTNGTINAESAELQPNIEGIKNFQQLIDYTLKEMSYPPMPLNCDYTYLFELCTKINRVVVPHKEYKLYSLVAKHNRTGKERPTGLKEFPKPRTYSLNSVEECEKAAADLPFNDEGYVVVDANLNRVKIKSPAYVAIHHMKGEGTLVPRRILDLIRMNEHEEFLSYFPEYAEYFRKVESGYLNILDEVEETLRIIENRNKYEPISRKEFAKWATKQRFPYIMFQYFDGKIRNAKEGLDKIKSEDLLREMNL